MPATESRIQQVFADLQSRGQMAFMPFVTGGDPDVRMTQRLLQELSRQGVDLIEIGFPYSDPIADGPVIQASYTRALSNGLKIEDLLTAIGELPTDDMPPLVAMVAYGIVFRIGPEAFLKRCQSVGIAGLIVPDLPGDEAEEFFQLASSHGIDLVQLIAPTTPTARVARILAACSGFVYCISVAGTTGVRDELPKSLSQQLKSLREQTDLPLAVGFGVSRPDQVDGLRGLAEGVIVGSAIVRRFENATTEPEADAAIASVGEFASQMLVETRKPNA